MLSQATGIPSLDYTNSEHTGQRVCGLCDEIDITFYCIKPQFYCVVESTKQHAIWRPSRVVQKERVHVSRQQVGIKIDMLSVSHVSYTLHLTITTSLVYSTSQQ